MNRTGKDRWVIVRHWPWRLLVFMTLVALILGVEHLVQTRWMPEAAAALGLGQFEASDEAARSLRTFECWHQALPMVAGALIAMAGLAVFAPLPESWVEWLKRTFA